MSIYSLCLQMHTLHQLLKDKYKQCLPTKPLSEHFSASQMSTLYFQSVSHQVGRCSHSTVVGTPSALTPADLPLDERDLCPGRSPNLSISSRQSRQRGNLQTHLLNSYLLFNGTEWELLCRSSRAGRQTVFEHELGKTKAKMLAAVMCVERNAPLLSLTELCKNSSVETFAWYSVGSQPPYAHTNTHTEPSRDPALRIF